MRTSRKGWWYGRGDAASRAAAADHPDSAVDLVRLFVLVEAEPALPVPELTILDVAVLGAEGPPIDVLDRLDELDQG